MIFVMTALPIAMLLLGFPILVILLVTAAVALHFFTPIPTLAIHQVMFGTLDSFSLLAIPFFIFAAEMMSRGGIARRLVDWTRCLLGRSKASLPLTTVGSMAMFGSISGSAPATIAAVGRITVEPMLRAGYDRRYVSGLIASEGVIANVIPPSVAIIVYGAVAEQSIVKLFAAGFLPGLLFACAFWVYVWAIARRSSVDVGERFELSRFFEATREAAWALGMPVVILGGIYSGVFSPTEAAGVAAAYSILVAVFIYREVKPAEILAVAGQAAYLTAQIMLIIAAAGVFSWLMTTLGVAAWIGDFFSNADLRPWLLLLLINILLLIVGCFLDTVSAILLLTPILLPIAVAAGVDPIHFGIVITTNLSIGMFTPPFGVNIFIVQSVFRQPVSVIYAGIWPFIFLSVAVLLLITFVPEISLFLTHYI